MMKPGSMLSHPGTLKKAPLSAETLDFFFLSELHTVPSLFNSVLNAQEFFKRFIDDGFGITVDFMDLCIYQDRDFYLHGKLDKTNFSRMIMLNK